MERNKKDILIMIQNQKLSMLINKDLFYNIKYEGLNGFNFNQDKRLFILIERLKHKESLV